ncbi:MAG: korB 2, partial [Bacteroidetes bacterium]|nr:korB 2 [Bacteroidota bacterium]
LQNCVIFNDGIHEKVTGRDFRDDRTITLKHGEPMIFGKGNDKGLILEGLKLKVVTVGRDGITEKDLLIHDAKEHNPGIHYMLANMRYPQYPVALGVIRSVAGNTYENDMAEQIKNIRKDSKIKSVDDRAWLY